MNDTEALLEHLQRSSSLSFSRSLFHAAEGRELLNGDFMFASAVSTYYSVFHLGCARILAYCSVVLETDDDLNAPDNSNADDPRAKIVNKLKKKWETRQLRTFSDGHEYYQDPAADIRHEDVPTFLGNQFSEILGSRDQPRTLRDMR